jgi:hypothetical protein
MIYQKRNGNTVVYYTKEEADEKGIKYIPWREARKIDGGEWVLSDDNIVLETTRVSKIVELPPGGITTRVRWRICTGLAKRYPHGRAPLNIRTHILTKRYEIYPDTWFERFDKEFPAIRSMLTKAVLTGVLRMSKSRRYTRDEYTEMIRIAKKIFDTKHRSWYHVRTYFGREEVREQIRQDIIKMAKQKGIDVEKVFNLIAEAEEFGRAKKDGKIILAVAREYGGIIGFNSLNKSITDPSRESEELPGAEDAYDRIIEKGSRNAAEAV